MTRRIPGNGHPVTTWVYGADEQSKQLATTLAVAVNTFSPMAHGVHNPPDRGRRGFTGDPGYGVNRWAGKTLDPVQHFAGAVQPIRDAKSKRLGAGAGVSGQPGLPSTGDVDPFGSLAWALGRFGNTGMGS